MQVDDRPVTVIAGVDSVDRNFDLDFRKSDLVLYKLLGDIERPKTLRLSDKTMEDFRESFRNSEIAMMFMNGIIKNKALVLLGYDSRDIYDNLFRAVINDMAYKLGEPLTKEIYFVGQLDYDNYYGGWERRNENDINIITLSSVEFLRLITRGFKDA